MSWVTKLGISIIIITVYWFVVLITGVDIEYARLFSIFLMFGLFLFQIGKDNK